LNGDSEFIVTIRFKGKSSKFYKTNKRQSWKWKKICANSKNPILKSDVGQMSFENRKKICRTQVVSTTRNGKAWSMDWWSSKKAQL
jgi:hypothetical protein